MNKRKLFIWSDAMTKTGFSIVFENLTNELYKDFEVHVLGINNYGFLPFDVEKYRMVYAIDSQDILGFSKMQKIIPRINPDVVYLHQDIFHIMRAIPIILQTAPRAKIVIHFPVDGAPFSQHWRMPLINSHARITYSQFGIDTIRQTFPDLESLPIEVLHPGVNFDIFKPISRQLRRALLREKGWEDKFVIVNVNRFMPRKLMLLSFRAYNLFLRGYNVCKCGNWYRRDYKRCDLNLCSSEDIIETVEGVGDKNAVLHMHSHIIERSMGMDEANTLLAHAENAGFNQKDVENKVISFNDKNIYNHEVPDEFVNELYNLACINLTTSLGEGAGMSLIEASAVGTTSIGPRNSAIPEMIGDAEGHLISNLSHVNIALDNGHMRPIVDIREVVKAIRIEYDKWVQNGRNKVINEKAMKVAKTKFSWEDKRERLKNILLE